MNLKALFNFNYFKENIRKSKGLLAFLLGVIPLVNIIFLIVLLTTSSSNLLTFNIISFLTYAGIIFVPIALSLTMFGFVFKQKSVDFIMSKPLSRKTIFITNTLGGILIIILFMLLNTLIFGLFSLIFSNLTIPFTLLIDYFIFWLLSYIFIFIVANLAISLSGNLITSIIVLLIIVLLIPFLNIINYVTHDYSSGSNYIYCDNVDCTPTKYYCYGDTNCENHLQNKEYELYYGEKINYNFIAPLSLANENYNLTSLFKMFVLSIIYYIIGYVIFIKRKMENNETSFKNNFAHYFVKGITFIPICLITYAIIKSTGAIGWLISIVGIVIYSIVYDLITKKEIFKPVKSFVITIILFLCFNGLYSLNFEVFESQDKVIRNVDSIVYNQMEIKDKELINYIIKSILEKNNDYYSYTDNLIFKVKNKEYIINANLNENIYKLLNDQLNIWNQNKSKQFNFNRINYIEYNDMTIPVTKKLKQIMKTNINNINKFNIMELSEDEIIYVYTYHNHQYEKLIIPIELCSELYENVIEYQNNEFIKYIEKISYEPYYQLQSYDSNIFSEEDYYVFNYVINSNKKSFIEYLKNDNESNLNKYKANIEVYYNKSYKVTINDLEAFKKEFENYQEKVKNNPEYQNLLKSYQETESND